MSKTKFALLLAGVVLAVVAYAPFYNGADQFRPAIQARLEAALQRKVESGPVRFSLWSGPAITVTDVVIHEEPRFGIEPAAYVTTLTIRPTLWKLLLGQVEIKSLRLEEPSLNLSRGEQGGWNWNAFLPSPGAAPVAHVFPEIEVRGGRVNFKFANRKSVFYFTEVDGVITLSPDSDGAYSVRFTASPARSDKPAQAFGQFRSRGRFWLPEWSEPRLDITFDLERSFLEEIMRLTMGRDLGLHTVLTSRTRLEGPLSNIGITGRVEVGEIPRWAILPGSGSQWVVNFKGVIDYKAQLLSIATDPPSAGKRPVGLRFRAENFLGQPQWGILADFASIPMEPFPGFARAVGIALPASWKLRGTATGVVGTSSRHGLNGKLAVREAAIAMGEEPEMVLAQADLLFENGKLASRDSLLEMAGDQSVVVDAEYNFAQPRWSYKWETKLLDIANTEKLRRLCAAPAVPWLSAWKKGSWSGVLIHAPANGEEQQWQGHLEFKNMQTRIPDLAPPLLLHLGSLDMTANRMRLVTQDAQVGALRWRGEYREDPKHGVFSLNVPAASISEVEEMLEPLLQRKRSFLARTLAFGKAKIPEWVAARRVDGEFTVGKLKVGAEEIEEVNGRVAWRGAKVQVTDLRYKSAAGLNRGKAVLDLAAPSTGLKVEKQ